MWEVHYENTPIQIYWEFYHQKIKIFRWKILVVFPIFGQNINCGYLLEPPRWGGSNEYQQSMFFSKNKEINVYPCKPQFYYIKMGFKGGKTTSFSWWDRKICSEDYCLASPLMPDGYHEVRIFSNNPLHPSYILFFAHLSFLNVDCLIMQSLQLSCCDDVTVTFNDAITFSDVNRNDDVHAIYDRLCISTR